MTFHAHELKLYFSEPTVNLADERLRAELALLDADLERIVLLSSRESDFVASEAVTIQRNYPGGIALPQDIIWGEQGTGLVRTSPDAFAIYDLAELIEAGLSRSDLGFIFEHADRGHGAVIGYSSELRPGVSERSISLAERSLEALRSGNREQGWSVLDSLELAESTKA